MSDDITHQGSLSATPPEDLADTVPDSPESRGGRTAGPEVPVGVWRYRILGPVGIGGMGVVYRALDTLLGRTVALKFLPPLLTSDPRAKARFLDEARAASALDHPNVCTIYEVGEAADGQLYLAMAYYDGETLKHRLERGPLEAAEALDIALQVARGLAKAHRQGIVHRDVKPANLVITADGIVKILDFGIAKLPGQPLAAPLLGTPAYMSPEQTRGEVGDVRSDVWSLGAVLHEMLTGRPLGQGRQEAAPEIDGVLSRMLAREPADRYPDAAALLDDLSALERAAALVEEARAGGALRRWLPVLAAALLVALAGAFGYRLLRGAGGHPEARSAPLRASLTRLTDLPGREQSPSLFPDGDLFVYSRKTHDHSHLFLQRVGGDNPMALLPDSSQDDTGPAFSPDGRLIAFRSERDGGGIFVMGATGESVRRVTDLGYNPAWSPDGREIAFATEDVVNPGIRRQRSKIFRVDLTTGEQRQVTGADAVQPSWSPHGFRIAYWGRSSGQRVIWTVPAGGGKAVPVTDGRHVDWDPVWSPDGRYLYFASDRSGVTNLWRVPIEERSGRVMGDPEPITMSSQEAMQLSISRDGRHIVYASGNPQTFFEKIDLDPQSGAPRSPSRLITQTSQIIFTLDASPDGRLVFASSVPQENLFVVRPDGTGLRQLTDDGFKNRHPRWSPDGTRIAFYSTRGGKYEIWALQADGSRLEQVTAVSGEDVYHPVWSPDGKQIACDIEESEALIDLTRPLPERHPQLLPPAGHGLAFSASAWSADGRWLAGILHRPHGPRIPGIVLYSIAGRKYVRVTDRGDSPTWFSDSRRLLYSDGQAIRLLDLHSRRARTILSAPAGSNDMILSPDDRTLYLVHSMDEGDIWLLTLK